MRINNVANIKTQARGATEMTGAPLVIVFGGMPFLSEKEGQILEAFPGVGSAGQQAPSANCATLPSAAGSLNPDQFEQDTVWYVIFQTPKSV